VADAPETVTAAVELLAAEGYDESLALDPSGVRCPGCDTAQPIDRVVVERVFRFEGASNPDDEAIVLGGFCEACGTRGTIVSAYGSGADPEILDSLVMLAAKIRTDGN